MNTTRSFQAKETLISRERVKKAINRQPTDRMPIDLGSHPSSGISAFAYWEMREKLGLSTDKIEITELISMLARVDEDVLKRFHCDFMVLKPQSKEMRCWNPRGKYNFSIPSHIPMTLNGRSDWIVENSGRMRMPKGGYFFDTESASWPELENRSEAEVLDETAKEAERIYNETDYYLIYNELYSFFRQTIDWMCRMVTEPDAIYEENRLRLLKEIEFTSHLIERMGNHIQAVSVASDLGTQQGPFVNPRLYDDLTAPFLYKFCSFIHENSDWKIMMHSCGSIVKFLPTLIECGIDMINPVQISASGMDPAELKSRFGEKIVFWGGGCDTQNVLEKGTREDVANNVRELVGVFKTGGGYIFNQVHNIMGNVPPENIITMLDTAYEESFYESAEGLDR